MKKIVVLFSGLIILSFVLSLLTMPSPALAQIPSYIDVKPGSCPNPINPKKKGVTPVAIVGTSLFDVTAVNPDTVMLNGLAPISWEILDTTQPNTLEPLDCYDCFDAEANLNCCCDDNGCTDDCTVDLCGGVCNAYCGDGIDDLILYFDTPALVEIMGAVEEDCLDVTIYGQLNSGDLITGYDTVILKAKGK